jgi:hypothetical protein
MNLEAGFGTAVITPSPPAALVDVPAFVDVAD